MHFRLLARFLLVFVTHCALILGTTQKVFAFDNYSSVLIGDMAAGMGGAFTGLTGDPAACSYYNPATLARMKGTSLSASANIYNKYDTQYGQANNFIGGAGRINRGNFRSIPASAGSVAAFGPFAIGLSIIVPDYDFFSGPILSDVGQDVSLNVIDESLWIGANMALNLTESSSVGFTLYYTSRFYQKSLVDNLKKSNGFAILTSEEKTFNNNSLIYLLGYYHQFNANWSSGLSVRFPSLEVHGRGSYFLSTIDTEAANQPTQTTKDQIPSETRIPLKVAWGVAYKKSGNYTYSFDITFHGREKYFDMDEPSAREYVEKVETVNFALGAEHYLKHWLRLRTGIFTNFSSHPEIKEATDKRSDHVDMWGFSANVGIFTSDKVSFTFGGYYTGGAGHTVERLNQRIQKIPKSKQVFSMLIGSAYFF